MNKAVCLNKYGNTWYRPGTTIRRALWYVVELLIFKTSIPYASSFKAFILRLFGAKVGKKVIIKPAITIKYPWFFELGDYSWLGEKTWIDNMAVVKIGSNVCVSQGAYIMTGNHDYKKETFDLIPKPVTIEDGAWVGAMAVICPGIVIHTHAVVTAGSVITKDAEPYKVYQGNPAKAVRDRAIS